LYLIGSCFLEFTDQRGLYRVQNDAVFSGAIDDSGAVLEVEEQSLSSKVRAVFFSSARTLAVPKDQLHLTLAEVSRLNERYPDRRLQVVGISHLEEVFFDRRLTDYRHISVARHLGRKAKRNSAIVSLTSALLLACAYLFWRYAAPISPNPVLVEFTGEQMVIRNGLGQTVDAPHVGVTTVQRHRELSASDEGDTLFDIADVDGDGYNEIIYVQYGRSLLEEPDTLVCYDVVERERIWSKPMFQDISFPQKPEVLDNRYRVVDLHVGGRSYGRIDFLVVVANHFVFFPSVVMTLDPLTGALLQRYVHVGQLAAAEFADLDDDGDLELIAAGTNNAFGMAAVMGLDPEHLEGHSPTRGDYDPAGGEEGQELFYVLIPRTIVGNAFRTVHGINGAAGMVLYQDAKRFEVSVQDVGGVDSEGKRVEAQLLYYFNFAGIPIAVGTSSAYDIQAKLLFQEGKIPTLPDKTYFETYLGLLRRWDRGSWVQARPTEPTGE